MSDPMKQAWEEVGDGFASLGRLMKDKYQAGGARPPTVEEAQEGRAALRDALEHLVDAAHVSSASARRTSWSMLTSRPRPSRPSAR